MKKDSTHRIKSYEDACKNQNRPVLTLADFAWAGDDQVRAFSNHCIDIICDAMREGIVFDYTNWDQQKWEILWQFVPGSGWVLDDVLYADTYTLVGARRSFISKKHAQYFAKQFQALYNAAQ